MLRAACHLLRDASASACGANDACAALYVACCVIMLYMCIVVDICVRVIIVAGYDGL